MVLKKANVFCDECEFGFYLDSVNIQNATIDIGGQNLTLVYFTCPKCNKIYRVSIIDARYIKLKQDLENAKKRIRRNHGSKNEELARMLNQMVFRKLQRLRNHVDKLNKMFPGTFIFVVSENNNEEKCIKYLP